MSGPGFSDPEVAKRAQRASVEARKRNRELGGFLAGHKVFSAAVEQLAKELLDAALGRGDWSQEFEVVVDRYEKDGQPKVVTKKLPKLDAKERAGLIVKCLEFGMGRPSQQPKREGEKPSAPEPPAEGFEVT